MTDTQAFSDSEIVAIAAVAAAALGGIVIGLGRGQANAASNRPGALASSAGEQTRHAIERARHALEETQPVIAERVPEARGAVRDAMRSIASPVSDRRGRRKQARQKITRVTERIDPAAARSLVEQASNLPLAGLAKTLAGRSGRADRAVSEPPAVVRSALEAVTETLRSASEGARAGAQERLVPAVRSAAESSRSSLEHVAHEIEERTPDISLPDLSRGEQHGSGVTKRAEDAAQRAAGRTKEVAGETLATVLWLGAASAVTYFALLSPERREQVKDLICAGFEQVRLLALDLQGYEPEM